MYRIDQATGDTIIDGFEQGISPSPYATTIPSVLGYVSNTGLADMRNLNTLSVTGEASVNFATSALIVPPTSGTISYTGSGSTGLITVTSTTGYYPGMAVEVQTSSVANTVSALVVAGGGGGSVNNGGGGAGGVISNSALAIALGSYTITIGAGGVGSGSNGSNSSIGSLAVATGGGAASGNNPGAAGGSGGGGGGNSGAGGTGIAGQGHNGGSGASGAGGGGGGAGIVGSNAGVNIGGNGGNGVSSSISGTAVTYGGGGGGFSSTLGTGGTGGGGNAGTTGGNGTANTGGGGGAGNTAGSGGSGIVIISYPTGFFSATGGTITTSGGNTIHTFTTTGTWNVTSINNLTPNTVYYVGSITPTTFELYFDMALTLLVVIVENLTGNLVIPQLGDLVWSTTYPPNQYIFLVDSNGNAWFIRSVASAHISANTLSYCGNIGHSATVNGHDFGIFVYYQYLFVIIGNDIDYISFANLFSTGGAITNPNNWVYGWSAVSAIVTQTNTNQHYAFVAPNGNAYFCNTNYVGVLALNAGTFDPTNASSYTFNAQALLLPFIESSTHLTYLGTNILVGGNLNYVYVWDTNSAQPSVALIMPEYNTARIVASSAIAYIFCGDRGRIYQTNGATVSYYQKVPDYPSGSIQPYYAWGDAMYWLNQLYFTLSAMTNANATLSTVTGMWAIDLATDALRLTNQLSYGTYGGIAPVLAPNLTSNPAGDGIYIGWNNSGTYGIDMTTTTLYTGGQAYVDTDLIPVGTILKKKTNSQIEYKLSQALMSGESVQVLWRGNLSDSFTSVGTGTAQTVSEVFKVDFEAQQWLQFRIVLTSIASNPSGVRLRELRFR